MSKRVRPRIPVNALRALADEQTRAGDQYVSLGRLLEVLDLEEHLIDIGLRIDNARSALARRDLTTVENHLERMEVQLLNLVDLPWRGVPSQPDGIEPSD